MEGGAFRIDGQACAPLVVERRCVGEEVRSRIVRGLAAIVAYRFGHMSSRGGWPRERPEGFGHEHGLCVGPQVWL